MTSIEDSAEAAKAAARVFLDENWELIARRSAASTSRRALANQLWRRRLAYVNKAALAVGVFLIAQFPFACYAFGKLQQTALEFCSNL